MARRAQDIYVEWRGGTCRVKWWNGEYHDDGRKRFESKGGFTDEDEAFQHGQDKLYEIRHGTHVKNRDGATLMSDWLDSWLAGLDHAHLTERNYRSIVETHIRPYFKKRNAAVADIDVMAYRAFRKHINSVLKPNTAKKVMTILGMILDDAVPRLIKVSPVERTRRRGKYTRKPKERKRDMMPEAVEQLAVNARTLLGEPGYVFIWTMAMTGMRPAELYGLTREYCYPNWPGADLRLNPDEQDRYEDDLERYGKGDGLMPAIRVERQVQYKGGSLTFMPPKYESYRTLVVPQFLAGMLEKLLESHDSKWVFPALEGGSLGVVNFDYRWWRPMADGADERKAKQARWNRPAIPAVPSFAGRRLYLLRHGAKAWLDEDGHSRYAVEARMGHELPGVEGTYSSVTVPMEQGIMKTLQERWERLQEKAGTQGA
ncbi:integrase [Streptomyces sp. V4I8]|uniref:tyrosine-type recombinase/integrase n=1 Tax=Streptomyces sp. V4I8 TaxID=3156469 RepID=UPI0035167208